MGKEKLILEQGGYRKLKSFQISQLVYDITVRFCDLYIDSKSRTKDQMVQAARSGVQNIAEGSQCAGTSKKFEIKLTNVARASQEELKLDYEDFLRQKGFRTLSYDDPILERFKNLKVNSLSEVQSWVKAEKNLNRSYKYSELTANAALSLLNLSCYLLDQQIKRLAKDFEEEGGFTERLYRVRKNKRRF